MLQELSASDFIGFGRLTERMFERTDSDAHTVVETLLSQAKERFPESTTDMSEQERRRAISAFVSYFAWQGLADQRDLEPSQKRQGGVTNAWSDSQLEGYRTRAAAFKKVLERYMPELTDEGEFDFSGPLYGGADIPAAFTFHHCDPPGRGPFKPSDADVD